MHGGATVLTVWKVQCTLISAFLFWYYLSLAERARTLKKGAILS